LARAGRYLVGPFISWRFRSNYANFAAHDKIRERLRQGLGSIHPLSVPVRSVERAYVDRDGLVWLLVESTAYDLVKHFRGNPKLWRRLTCLWSIICRSCGHNPSTTLRPISSVCNVCGGSTAPVVFWRDAYSREVRVGPCNVVDGLLECSGTIYYTGEILRLFRDLAGNIYADVLAFTGSKQSDEMRLVEVDELPNIVWSRPVMLA
jgi:hypothetical protein